MNRDTEDRNRRRAAAGPGVAALTADAAGGLPPTTIHGVNFQIKAQTNTNFCVQIESGTSEGRLMTLQSCGLADDQRWALTAGANGLNELIDSQGMCVDVKGHQLGSGLLAAFLCTHSATEQLTYTSAGQLIFKSGECLSVPGDAANTQVDIAACDLTKIGQQWLVTH